MDPEDRELRQELTELVRCERCERRFERENVYLGLFPEQPHRVTLDCLVCQTSRTESVLRLAVPYDPTEEVVQMHALSLQLPRYVCLNVACCAPLEEAALERLTRIGAHVWLVVRCVNCGTRTYLAGVRGAPEDIGEFEPIVRGWEHALAKHRAQRPLSTDDVLDLRATLDAPLDLSRLRPDDRRRGRG